MKKLLLLLLFSHTLLAQPDYHFDLLKDINSSTNDANVKFVFNVGNTAVIFHSDKDITTGKTTLRLWKNNGNTLENFASSESFSEHTTYREPIVIDDYIFFYVQNNSGGENGIYLAKLDSPVIKYIIYSSGPALSTPNITVLKFNSRFYISSDSQHDSGKLYHYNENTNQITEIQGNEVNFYNPQNVTIINNKLFFTATTGDIFEPRQQLWTSDGTNSGTHIVKELAPDGMTLGHLARAGNKVIFDAVENGVYSLYVSNGTAAGTYPFKNLSSFSTYEYSFVTIDAMYSFGDKAFVLLANRAHEIWLTDGTDTNTKFVSYYSNVGLFQNKELAIKDSCMFFTDGGHRFAKTDGNTTTILSNDGATIPFYRHFKMVFNPTDDNLYCMLNEAFYKTNGTTTGTYLINNKLYSDFPLPDYNPFAVASNKIFAFTRPRDYRKFGNEIYEIRSDTIRLTKDLNPTTKSADVQFVLNANKKSYFYASSHDPIVRGIYETDGTPEGTIGPVANLFGYSQNFISFNGRLYMLKNNQLLKINFANRDFEVIKTFTKSPQLISPIQTSTKFYFVLTGNYEQEVWVSDGTVNGTMKIATFDETETFENFALYNQQLYVFTTKAGTTRVWKYSSDTTPPTLIKTINSYPAKRNYAEFRNKIAFMIYSQNGTEIWTTDGTTNGTTQINSFPAGTPINADAILFTDNFYYYSILANNQTKIWKSDGTPAGTTLIADIVDAYSDVKEFCLCNNEVFFALKKNPDYDRTHLYKSTIGSATSSFITSVRYMDFLYTAKNFYCVSKQLYFSVFGSEINYDKKVLYTSNGTTEGTKIILRLENKPDSYASIQGGDLYPLNDHELLIRTNDKMYNVEWFTFRKCEPVLTNLDGIATDSKIQTSPTFIESTEKITAENKVYYYAPKSITLNAGFTANSQSVFKAEIKNKTCTMRE